MASGSTSLKLLLGRVVKAKHATRYFHSSCHSFAFLMSLAECCVFFRNGIQYNTIFLGIFFPLHFSSTIIISSSFFMFLSMQNKL